MRNQSQFKRYEFPKWFVQQYDPQLKESYFRLTESRVPFPIEIFEYELNNDFVVLHNEIHGVKNRIKVFHKTTPDNFRLLSMSLLNYPSVFNQFIRDMVQPQPSD
jgi:hypothetical protein